MAILTEPRFSGATINTENEYPTQSIYEESATQNYKLGTKLVFGDGTGRIFRYAKNGGTALVQATMNQSAVQESKAVAIAQAGYARSVGETDITMLVTTGSASPENAFAGGLLCMNKVSPAVLGDVYAILASKLQSDDTLLDLKLEWPGIRNAMLATGEVSLTYNPWYASVVHPVTTATARANGVSLIPVTANYFYWSQTGGPAPLIVDNGDTLTIGDPVGIPATSGDAGEAGLRVTVQAEWGQAISIATGDEPAVVYLTLD
jgi:hypothetical protein